jgi:hypothetical protein
MYRVPRIRTAPPGRTAAWMMASLRSQCRSENLFQSQLECFFEFGFERTFTGELLAPKFCRCTANVSFPLEECYNCESTSTVLTVSSMTPKSDFR